MSCRNRKVRNSINGSSNISTSQNHLIGSNEPARTPILNVAKEYEVALNKAASLSPSSLQESSQSPSAEAVMKSNLEMDKPEPEHEECKTIEIEDVVGDDEV